MSENKSLSEFTFANCIRGAVNLSDPLSDLVLAGAGDKDDESYPNRVLAMLALWLLRTLDNFRSVSLLTDVGVKTGILTEEDREGQKQERRQQAETMLALMCLIARYTKERSGADNILKEGAFIPSELATTVTYIIRMHVSKIEGLENLFDEKMAGDLTLLSKFDSSTSNPSMN